LGFFNYGCDHYTQQRGGAAITSSGEIFGHGPGGIGTKGFKNCKGVDLWKTDKPAYGMNGTYSGITFSNEVQRVITSHDTSKPLFMYIAWQNDHAPLEVPKAYTDRCDASLDPPKKTYCGMTAFMDDAMGNMTTALKQKKMWDDSLIVFRCDPTESYRRQEDIFQKAKHSVANRMCKPHLCIAHTPSHCALPRPDPAPRTLPTLSYHS
jgi:hypothetical protein